MSGGPQRAGSLFRKVVAALIVVPLAVVIIAFAIANRQDVTVSFDPFDPAHAAYSITIWLFVPILAALIAGVAIGGLASWLRHGRWRRVARRLEREAHQLRGELESHKRSTGLSASPAPPPGRPADRLQLRAPVR